MAFLASSYPPSQLLLRPNIPKALPWPKPSSISLHYDHGRRRSDSVLVAAAAKSGPSSRDPKVSKKGEVEVEVEEDLPWIQEKALDLVEFTGSVTQAIPGPRVGTSSLPWILALPLGYAGLTIVIAFVKTVRKFTSPKHKRKKLVRGVLVSF